MTTRSVLLTLLLLLSASASRFAEAAPDYPVLWWDPAQSGQGVVLWVDGSTVFGGWFSYDPTANDMWLTFSGQLAGNTLTASLLRYTGPTLGGIWGTNLVRGEDIGTMTLTFTSATTATFVPHLYNVTKTLNLQPFSPFGPFLGNGIYANLWWDPDKSGQGIATWQQGNILFGGWYLYDETGNDLWVTFSGELQNNTLNTTLERNNGIPLGQPWEVSRIFEYTVGTLTLSFSSPSTATLVARLNSQDLFLELEPFSVSPPPASGSGFDGTWQGSANPTTAINRVGGNCTTTAFTLLVSNRVIGGAATDGFGTNYSISGNVTDAGIVAFKAIASATQSNSFVGKFIGNSATGTWNDSYGCQGAWNASH